MTDNERTEPGRPRWRKIVDFPLVSLLIALALLIGAFAAANPAVQALTRGLPRVAATPISALVAAAIAIAIAKLVVARLGDERRDDLPFDRRMIDAAAGSAIAFVLMSAIVALAAGAGAYRISGWGGGTSWPLLLFGAGLQAAVFEEVLIRGILFRFLEQFGGSWFALAASSALFGLGHIFNPNATAFSSLAIAIEAGVMLGGAYMLTRNLWLAIGLHFGWNVTQGYVWDVPVSGNAVDGLVASRSAGSALLSGGAFGLEASVIALALATPLGVWFVYRAVRKGHLVRPWWVRRRLTRRAAAV